MVRVKRVLSALCVAVAAAGLILIVTWLACAHTQRGRRWLADRIESVVTDNIPGRLSIGELVQVRWLSVRARDLRFLHPDGRCVLQVDHAMVEPSLWEAFQNGLTFRRVVVDGGNMLLSSDSDGRLSFEAVVSAPSSTEKQAASTGGLHYDLRNMHIENFALQIELANDDRYRMSGVSGRVHVRRTDSPGTQVLLEDIEGKLAPEIAGARLVAKRLDARIDSDASNVADVHARVAVDGDDTLTLRVLYAPDKSEKIRVRVLAKEGTEATALTWLLHAAASFSSTIRIES